MPSDNDLAEALAFRVGRKVPRNIYRGDEPVCMVATAEAAEELVTLLNLGAAALRARPEARAGDGTGWQDISTAPMNQSVEVRCGAMSFLARLMPGVSLTEEGRSCDQWWAVREGEHPPCWSEGACWASNDDEGPSLQPDAWRAQTVSTSTDEAQSHA